MLEKIKEILKTKKGNILSFLVFLLVTGIVFIGSALFSQIFARLATIIPIVTLVLLLFVSGYLAGYAVIKSLFFVGAELSLVIFLAVTYCEVPESYRTGNEALKILLIFSLFFIGISFLRSLYKEINERSKTLGEINGKKHEWLVQIPFAVFTGIFIWQIYQVIYPIISSLCIYTK